MPRLKICGITTLEDARFCAAAGVDYIGFVMDPNSPRYVEPELVRDIVEWVVGPKSVAVFVNEDPDSVNRLGETMGVDLVQLHGGETPEDCRRVTLPLIKAISVSADSSIENLTAGVDRYAPVSEYLMFDTSVDGRTGGTGVPFDWNLLSGLTHSGPIFLAGGINGSNVARAVQCARPYAIDVSSGVETSPGRKDFGRITELLTILQNL